MATRLDLSGLSYLWDKIKAKFATKDTATTSAAGLMSATDKAKLDGIAAGATANVGTVTSVATGTGLKGGPITGSGTISTNVPRVAKDSKSLPGANTWILEEYTSGSSYNLPSNHWYYIFSMQGSDAKYGAQLALGMTTSGAYYRECNNQTWGAWKSLIDTNAVTSVNNQTGAVSITPANLEVLRTGQLNPANLDTILYNFLGTVWRVTGTGVSVFGSNCGTLICTDTDPFGTSGSRLQQIFMNFFGNDIWIRKRTDTTWSEWTCLRQNNGAIPVTAGGTGATDVPGAQNNILSGLFRLYDGGTVSNLAIGNRTAGRVTVYRYGPNTTGAPVSTAAGIAVLGVNLDNANYGWMLSTSDIGMYWRALDGGSYGAWKAIAIP